MQDAEHRILDVTHSLVKALHLVLTGTIYQNNYRGAGEKREIKYPAHKQIWIQSLLYACAFMYELLYFS